MSQLKLLQSKWAKKSIIGAIIVILILTLFEFPAPIGFETRPQNNVSIAWLFFFLVIVITEIATIPFILKKPRQGAKLGVLAGILNIMQVIADQLHLMQPEVASLQYSLLEGAVAVVSLVLIYLSLKVNKIKGVRNK